LLELLQWFVQKFKPTKGVFATMSEIKMWIGVDLDGTLAYADDDAKWNRYHIGDPIPAMAERVREALAAGERIKIFTARVGTGAGFSPVSGYEDTQEFADQQREMIQDWTEEHFGVRLEVTAQKDWAMKELWDDRAKEVVKNTGRFAIDFWKALFRDIYQAMGGVRL
jgi:hypothetical protein